MNRFVRVLWMMMAAIYLSACATAPASQGDRPVTAADCRDVPVATPQSPTNEPMPCARPMAAPPAQLAVAILLAALVIGVFVAAAHVVHTASFPAGFPGGAR